MDKITVPRETLNRFVDVVSYVLSLINYEDEPELHWDDAIVELRQTLRKIKRYVR